MRKVADWGAGLHCVRRLQGLRGLCAARAYGSEELVVEDCEGRAEAGRRVLVPLPAGDP